MFFFTKALFKHTAPRYSLPGRIDAEFYLESKKLLSENKNFKFRSDLNFWNSYRYIFMVFLIFIVSALLLCLFFAFSIKQPSLIFGILIFILILTAQPAIYFSNTFYKGEYADQTPLKEKRYRSPVVNKKGESHSFGFWK